MTAAETARMLGNEDFYAEAAKLFCKFCKKAVDHRSQSVVNRHLISDKHTKNKKDPNRNPAKTITTASKVSNAARLQNIRLVSKWVPSCAASNIPPNAASDNITMRNVSVCQRRNFFKFLLLISFFFRVIYRVIHPHSSLYRVE